MTSSFGFKKPEDSPGFLLWQTTISWQRRIKKVLEKKGISHSQFVILAILLWCHEMGQAPIQSFIVEKSKLDKMTVSHALKKLHAMGLLKRDEHAIDTRAKQVALTAKGRALIKKCVPLVEAVDAEFFQVLGISRIQELIRFLRQLVRTPTT